MKKLILSSVIGVAFAFGSGISNAGSEDIINLPPALAAAANAGVNVISGFETGSEMMGWYAETNGQPMIVYTPPSGDAVLIGAMLDASGKNVTAEHQEMFFPKPDYTAQIDAVKSAEYYVQGNPESKNIVYGFHEPNCGFCARAVNEISEIEGDYQVRWIPVAFLSEKSPHAVETLLTSSDPATDMLKHKAGVLKLKQPTEKTLNALEFNNQLMKNLGIKGTPAFVRIDGGELDVKASVQAGQFKSLLRVN